MRYFYYTIPGLVLAWFGANVFNSTLVVWSALLYFFGVFLAWLFYDDGETIGQKYWLFAISCG